MDPQWKVKKGELWLTLPFLMRLASYGDLPMSMAFASVSADIEAELVTGNLEVVSALIPGSFSSENDPVHVGS
jgi:hypothetical protein